MSPKKLRVAERDASQVSERKRESSDTMGSLLAAIVNVTLISEESFNNLTLPCPESFDHSLETHFVF